MFRNAVEIIDIFGFKIRIDPSWLLIAALIVWSLSSSYFPNMVPGLSFYDYVALGTISMLGLFISLILHELSHSLMARQFGLKVGNITLFIFGGVAELEQEPKSPKSEFWISHVALGGPSVASPGSLLLTEPIDIRFGASGGPIMRLPWPLALGPPLPPPSVPAHEALGQAGMGPGPGSRANCLDLQRGPGQQKSKHAPLKQ